MSDRAARILVVDDVPENVRLLASVLEAHGYDIVSATDGQAALELAVSANPDLVLLDLMMLPPDGYAVCRRLREQEETAVLPVIMLVDERGAREDTSIRGRASPVHHVVRDRARQSPHLEDCRCGKALLAKSRRGLFHRALPHSARA